MEKRIKRIALIAAWILLAVILFVVVRKQIEGRKIETIIEKLNAGLPSPVGSGELGQLDKVAKEGNYIHYYYSRFDEPSMMPFYRENYDLFRVMLCDAFICDGPLSPQEMIAFLKRCGLNCKLTMRCGSETIEWDFSALEIEQQWNNSQNKPVETLEKIIDVHIAYENTKLPRFTDEATLALNIHREEKTIVYEHYIDEDSFDMQEFDALAHDNEYVKETLMEMLQDANAQVATRLAVSAEMNIERRFIGYSTGKVISLFYSCQLLKQCLYLAN